jgi:putative solute:sodium symporter small subunit
MQNASHSMAASKSPWAISTTSTLWPIMATPMLHLERHFGVRRLKRSMLTMLAAWLGYFIIISMWARALNKVTVPLLDIPLGVFLVAQGTAVIFLAALVLLVRTSGNASTAR